MKEKQYFTHHLGLNPPQSFETFELFEIKFEEFGGL